MTLPPLSYCQAIASLDSRDINRIYHDTKYGFPIESDDELFERLVLEINQAGLSWSTILKKQESFKVAYSQFSIEKVANYTDSDIQRLLDDPGIIRNRLKIDATIHNAKVILSLKNEHGTFKHWLDKQGNRTKESWTQLFKGTFKFTGGEITKEFLLSTGYLPGSHEKNCPVYQAIIDARAAVHHE